MVVWLAWLILPFLQVKHRVVIGTTSELHAVDLVPTLNNPSVVSPSPPLSVFWQLTVWWKTQSCHLKLLWELCWCGLSFTPPPPTPVPTRALCMRKRWSFSVLSVVVVFRGRSKHADGSNWILFVLTRQNSKHSFLTRCEPKKVQKKAYLL